MYFFLSNLSFIDICHSSVTVPKMLEGLLLVRKTISFDNCIAQLFFLHLFACAEIFLLTIMAYDRYVAICAPLHYTSVMNMRVCVQLVFALWLGGTAHSLVQTFLTIRLPYCGPNVIDSYFCDVPPVIKLACTDTYLTGMLIVSNSGTISLTCFLALVASYMVILVSLRKQSVEVSLEAEHRLLREVGWHEDSENDETCAPLTEDEMREFQVISEQLQKNGLRKNGILKNSLICDFKFGPWKNSTFKPLLRMM
ncbi:Olfactory Receptor 4E2 [Manis pentadactyla]|nr:Olfactory Receptor 4E2 [Manis pentadactyla]